MSWDGTPSWFDMISLQCIFEPLSFDIVVFIRRRSSNVNNANFHQNWMLSRFNDPQIFSSEVIWTHISVPCGKATPIVNQLSSDIVQARCSGYVSILSLKSLRDFYLIQNKTATMITLIVLLRCTKESWLRAMMQSLLNKFFSDYTKLVWPDSGLYEKNQGT